ncbi:MAG: segregation/condensation protein A [Candidatus Sumerlaeia bacterium]|nr:segregation/condensation protein A [Candidatus Sumerlaeia bacterium]
MASTPAPEALPAAPGGDAPSEIRVQTEVFEGPFDLLLHLVRVNEMDIFDIRIEQITEHYLAHLARMERHNLEIAGEFLVMAATLLNIKSRQLLPANPHLEEEIDEGEGTIHTTADLVRQLIEYRRFKEIAQVLGDREAAQLRVFYRTQMPAARRAEDEPAVPPQAIDTLLAAFARVIQAVGIDRRHEVLEDEAQVEDALAIVRSVLDARGHTRLSELLRSCRTRSQMIVTVLALLEMARLQEIRIEQLAVFEDVHILRRDAPVEPNLDAPEEMPEPLLEPLAQHELPLDAEASHD